MFSKTSVRIGTIVVTGALVAQVATAMEDTKVLPKGVRNVILRSVNVDVNSKTDANGAQQSLGSDLEKGVTFKRLTDSQVGLDRSQAEAFMLKNGFSGDEEIGSYTADVRGRVNVIAPVFSYGVTDRWTLGVAAPIYRAQTSVEMGFKTNARGQEFINLLASPQYNNTAKAREAAAQMNSAVAKFQGLLAAHNYEALDNWSATGLGDVRVVSRYRALESNIGSLLINNALILPTGRTDDPNILNDVEFGTGAYAAMAGVSIDEPLIGPLFLNQYAQYTAYLPTTRELRMKRPDEVLAVETAEVAFDGGDIMEMGASLQGDADNGLQGGLGYNWSKKLGDKIAAGDSRATLEAGTMKTASNAEAAFGYSSVNAYKRGTSRVPYTTLGTYRKHLKSTNSQVRDELQFDMKVYF